MINEKEAGVIVEKMYPQYKAMSSVKFGEGFVVACGNSNGEELNDCFFAVSGNGVRVLEFNPTLCMNEFIKALPKAVQLH